MKKVFLSIFFLCFALLGSLFLIGKHTERD